MMVARFGVCVYLCITKFSKFRIQKKFKHINTRWSWWLSVTSGKKWQKKNEKIENEIKLLTLYHFASNKITHTQNEENNIFFLLSINWYSLVSHCQCAHLNQHTRQLCFVILCTDFDFCLFCKQKKKKQHIALLFIPLIFVHRCSLIFLVHSRVGSILPYGMRTNEVKQREKHKS